MKLSGASFKRFFSPGELLLAIPALLLLAYIFIRAKLLSLTWDESYTFFEFVRHSSWFPGGFNYMSANNHLLNTWLMKCSVSCFGETEIALRLPNIIAAGFYFFWSLRLLKKLFTNKGIILAAFLVIALNPFVLDFFSLARGYGISLALMMGALYQLTIYLKEERTIKRAIQTEIFLLLAVLANLTLLHLFAATVFVFLADQFLQKTGNRGRNMIKLILLPLLFLGGLFFYLRKLQISGAFFFGKEMDSAGASLQSVFTAAAYDNAMIGKSLFVFFLLIAVTLVFFLLIKRKKAAADFNYRWAFVFFTILFCAFAGTVLQHYVLGSNFLSRRTGLFLVPLFSCVLIALFLQWPKPIAHTLLVLFAGGSVYLFAVSFNLKYTLDFREQADLKAAMRELKDQKPGIPTNLFADVLTTGLPYDLPANYYKMRFNIQAFGHVARNEELPGASWYYLTLADAQKYSAIELVRKFPETNTGLFRSTADSAHFKVMLEGWDDFDHYYPYPSIGKGPPFFGKQGTKAGGETNFSALSRLEHIDTLTERPVAASISCRLNTTTKNVAGLLVFLIMTDTSSSWQYMHLSELSEKPGEWSITGWTRPLPVDTKEVRLFIWNESDALVYMDNVAIRLIGKNDP